MRDKKKILVILGSASQNSANEKIVNCIVELSNHAFDFTVYRDLKILPPFDPELSVANPPQLIVEFRTAIEQADGVWICTPEYIFSLPAGLKNAIEWCVSTTVFSDKPVGMITASLDGQKAHEQLQLIMKTLMTKCTSETSLLIRGVKGKLNESGEIKDNQTLEELTRFVNSYKAMVLQATN